MTKLPSASHSHALNQHLPSTTVSHEHKKTKRASQRSKME